MSPEQMQPEMGVDKRADLYALGTIAYLMLGGKTPFSGDLMHSPLQTHYPEMSVKFDVDQAQVRHAARPQPQRLVGVSALVGVPDGGQRGPIGLQRRQELPAVFLVGLERLLVVRPPQPVGHRLIGVHRDDRVRHRPVGRVPPDAGSPEQATTDRDIDHPSVPTVGQQGEPAGPFDVVGVEGEGAGDLCDGVEAVDARRQDHVVQIAADGHARHRCRRPGKARAGQGPAGHQVRVLAGNAAAAAGPARARLVGPDGRRAGARRRRRARTRSAPSAALAASPARTRRSRSRTRSRSPPRRRRR